MPRSGGLVAALLLVGAAGCSLVLEPDRFRSGPGDAADPDAPVDAGPASGDSGVDVDSGVPEARPDGGEHRPLDYDGGQVDEDDGAVPMDRLRVDGYEPKRLWEGAGNAAPFPILVRGVGLREAAATVQGVGLEVTEVASGASGLSLVLLVRAEVDEALPAGATRTATIHVTVPGGRFSVPVTIEGLPELELPGGEAALGPLPTRVSRLRLRDGRATLTATAPVHIEVVGLLEASGALEVEGGATPRALGGCSPGDGEHCERRSGAAGPPGASAGGGGGGAGGYDGAPGARARPPAGSGGDASADVSPFPLRRHVGGAGGAGAGAAGPDGAGAGGTGAGVFVITVHGRTVVEEPTPTLTLRGGDGRPGAPATARPAAAAAAVGCSVSACSASGGGSSCSSPAVGAGPGRACAGAATAGRAGCSWPRWPSRPRARGGSTPSRRSPTPVSSTARSATSSR
jgi:hypothetical protein